MSFLATLRAGPPPPKVALLPDGLFFTRAVSVAAGAAPGEAASQIELALEAVSPFPIAQLYYGYYWVPGSESALVFAAYRRRFTAEQTALWESSELVIPAFAAVLAAPVEPATTVLLSSPEGLTAIHWVSGPVAAQVVFRPLPPVAEGAPEPEPAAVDAARAQLRDELIREAGGSHRVVDLALAPVAETTNRDREFRFRCGELVSHFSPVLTAGLDVRDKGELASLRAARRRDVILWRVTVGCAAALVALAVGELGLMGGKAWQQIRDKKFRAQRPVVEQIMTSQSLANRIDDLATKRLLPWEMMMAVIGQNRERLPKDIQFGRVYTIPAKGLYTIAIEGQTTNIASMPSFKSALKAMPGVENVDGTEQTRGGIATFTLLVTFKPDAIRPGALL